MIPEYRTLSALEEKRKKAMANRHKLKAIRQSKVLEYTRKLNSVLKQREDSPRRANVKRLVLKQGEVALLKIIDSKSTTKHQ